MDLHGCLLGQGARADTPEGIALTLHFCDEVFADRRAQKFRGGTREPPGPDVRTPHFRAPNAQISKRQGPNLKIVRGPAGRRNFLEFGGLEFLNFARSRASSLLAFTRARAPIGFARAAEAARWESVMRYRSATVAGFHGLPCFPEVSKERQSAPVLAGTRADHKSFSYQCIAIRR
ncbi:MAG TPA: hypothetical protein VK717_03540 [Opitutaceae bacterium]|nr:hypothetical protein [Opitutaceae bacterium]